METFRSHVMRSFHLTSGLVCVSEWNTQNDELGFALDPHPCAGSCSHLHTVLHSRLQPADYHWTDGCIHRLIDMKAGFVGQTPDLTKTDTPDRIHCKVVQYDQYIQFATASGAEFTPTLYSWMMPFCWSEGGGSHDTLMDVLLWLPTVTTVTCCGGAPGADDRWQYIRTKRIKSFSMLIFFTEKRLFLIMLKKEGLTHYLKSYSHSKQHNKVFSKPAWQMATRALRW